MKTKQRAKILANRIAVQLGEPLTDRKLHDYLKERDRRGLPFPKDMALAIFDLTGRVRPEHRFTAEEEEEWEAALGIPPHLRASADR